MSNPAPFRVRPEYRVSTRPIYQQIVERDAVPPPAQFRDYAETAVPIAAVPRERYISPRFAELEIERMWSRVWQYACREEEIAEPGDCAVYDGPGASILVVRGDDMEIRAFYNSCPHRGMRMCFTNTSVPRFTCPFHSMQWSLEGRLQHIPSEWDFLQVDRNRFNMKPVRAECWGGFVFINRDPDAIPLLDYLGRIVPHFEGWDRSQVYLSAQIRKTVSANWKVCIEGFLEAYHLSGVHAQALPFGGDSSTQYDVWPDDPNVNRFLQPIAFQSDQWPRHDLNEQEIAQAAIDVTMGPGHKVELQQGQTARDYMIAAVRGIAGPDLAHHSDSELADAMQYMLFPNFVLFRSFLYPLAYRFLPVPGNPDETMFDMLIFKPKIAGEEPPPVEYHAIGLDQSYTETGVLPAWLAQIYDQDASAFPFVQQGMHDGSGQDIVFSSYQEVRLRHLHQTLGQYIGDVS